MRECDCEYYELMFEEVSFQDGAYDKAAEIAECIRKNRKRYSEAVDGYGIPWMVIALIHQIRAGGDFSRQILTGEPWRLPTKKPPRGLGPWRSWEHSVAWVIRETEDMWVFKGQTDWSVPKTLNRLERYFGLGYLHQDLPSPHLWAGSGYDKGVGRFVEYPGPRLIYQPDVKDDLVLGVGPILKVLKNSGESV